MKKIHILFAPQSLGQHNAWSKAPRDVTAILKRNGYETLRIMTSDKFPFVFITIEQPKLIRNIRV